ncbi:hypothetical protein Pfo_020811 [Paulownia fortunei]|nr:hypothetical protein Pfo_020811 [Paulownia fortunei]
MADAAVTFLLEKVSEVLKSYADLISGAENDLHQLNNELGLLKSFLQDAAKKPKKEEFFREIERQIRDVVYDAEDTIDSCLTQAAKAKAKFSLRRRFSASDVNLATQVKSLREDKVKPVLDKINKYANMQFGDRSGTTVEEPWTTVKKVQSIRQDNIVGFEDEEETIMNYLLEPKEELDVISIIGMPGLGKTTLAWKIYQSQKIQFEFPVRIWVYISQVLNRKDVLLTILKEFTSQDMSSLSDHDLALTVRKYLEEGKFFLVMDDVWSVEAWNAIRDVLPKSNRTSKVLITSRYTNVGMHANRIREPHNLRFLTEEESWELLQLEVFGKLDDCPQELKAVGKHIAKQCDGLPLAIVVIGGILLDLRSTTRKIDLIKDTWLEVSGNVSMYVKNNKEYDISEIVAMSYNRLPDDLRDCFLYLGVFPEDYEIPAWTLTRLWIAEGFIRCKEGQSLEKTAEENLKELIDRNLVMVDKINPNDEVKTCRVHDVIHAFCSSKGEIKEQNLYQEIKMSKEGVFQPSISEIQKYRRLCIHSHLPEFLSKTPKGPRVRSFLSFNKVPDDLNPKYTSAIPDAFDLLRVLDSKSIKFKQFPKGVTKLIHLRYITVSGENLDSLPKAISDLWNLQSLVVDTNSSSLTIEANIWRMIQLRHLKTKAAIILAIKGEGEAGENLQTLSRLSPDYCTEDVFNRARNLKRLGIRGKLATLLGGKSLGKLYRLEKLKLVNDKSSTDRLHGLPQPNFFPSYLKRLTISATSLGWTHMSTLAKIDSLQVLKLKNKAFIGQSWEAFGYGFPRLHYLLIEDTDLAVWEASTDHFPSLKSLVLKNCENLIEIPVGLTKSLEILDIDRLGRSAVQSAKKIEEEKKLMHGQPKSRWGGRFKLSVGPGCEVITN